MDTLLDNAYRALQLRPDEDYVVDQDRARSNITTDLEPQVIINDQDTGTDQTSSQWDGGIHKFPQLKECCKVTLQSLKAVFVSNAAFIKSKRKIAGVSGTLGSERECKFMSGKFKCNFFEIPTALPKCFTLKPTAVYKTKESWLVAVNQETRLTDLSGDKIRSIIIFCRSIKGVNTVYQHLKNNLASRSERKKCKIHRYTRTMKNWYSKALNSM
jgi:preprotein translocase subunit SecA